MAGVPRFSAAARRTFQPPFTNITGQFVIRVLSIPAPQCDKYSDHTRAWENRARRHWRHDGVRVRAKLLAEEFGLPIRFD